MASITKRCRHKRPEWETCGCSWYVRRRVSGRDQYTPIGPDKQAAQRALQQLEATPSETVSQAVDLWLEAKQREPGARSNSLASYRGRARHVRAFFGGQRVTSVRPEDVDRFVQGLLERKAPATVQGIYACLTAVLRHAQRRGVIRHLPLPLDGPGIPEVQPRRHALTLEQVETVIGRMVGVWARVAELILLTGLRWGEVVAIERADIEGRVVRVSRTRTRTGTTNPPKTRAGIRVIPLSRRAREILRELDLPIGGDYRRSRDALMHAMSDLHRPGMGWHTIRNAHATLLDASGVTLRDSAARMGHGHHYAQTLAYGIASEAGSADALDRARQRAAQASRGSGRPADLARHRARRRRASP